MTNAADPSYPPVREVSAFAINESMADSIADGEEMQDSVYNDNDIVPVYVVDRDPHMSGPPTVTNAPDKSLGESYRNGAGGAATVEDSFCG